MKKVISVFLSLAMVLTMFATTPLTASAETYQTTIDGITYEIDIETGEAKVDYAESSITAANILSEVDGYSVTSIGDYAFSDCTSLTAVTIPDSVTSIGIWAFSYCTSLTAVTIPDSVTNIGDYAFRYCTSLTEVTIPDSVTSIGDNAFSDCHYLTTLTIPDSVKSIGVAAFWNCSALTSVTIEGSVTSIDEKAFGYYDDDENYESHKIENFTIYGYKGSTAEAYANENEFKFVSL